MKKHNDFCKKIFISFFILITIFLVSCKTTGTGNIVDPLNLLSADKTYYCSIPSDFDDGIYEQLQNKFDLEISNENIDLIKKYIDLFYISTNSLNNLNSLELIIWGNFPAGYINNYLSKNANLAKNTLQNELLSQKYKYFSFNGLNICILSKQIAVISYDLLPILIKYEKQLFTNSFELSEPEEFVSSKIHDFFVDNSNSFLMYASTNNIFATFLKSITNLNIDLPNFEVFQEISILEEDENYYECRISAEFESVKFAKITKSLLNFVLTFSDDVILTGNENIINLENIKLDKKSLFDFF